jgi:hypothetical protein
MRRLLGGLLVLSLALTAWAAGDETKPKHNTLTPDEAAEGWILLFDGESTFGWRSPNGSKWHVFEGNLYPESGNLQGLLLTTTAFADYDLVFQYVSRPDSQAELRVSCDGKGNALSGGFRLQHQGRAWSEATASVRGGQLQGLMTRSLGDGPSFRTATKAAPPRPDSPVRAGHIGFFGNNFVLRSLKLKPVGATALFNGRDLTGWKEHPGKKSKFSVTPEGWLNVKNGPGDLQTEKGWADFLLQLECISNGKHLNSGVFFRCRPGEYQQGYEAQIHNGFTEKPTKEYTVEEYDPQTHELKDKKKVKSTAIDYGTGAIYRRVPARRAAARDGEWFALTVVAQGRHIATWVNGIQTVDWTDNRPAMDNARNGCRLEAGPISLQGHDPTTDLSFRNIRLADLAPKQVKQAPKDGRKE